MLYAYLVQDDRHRPEASLRILAVVSQKGGTGKTTTTVNLAAALGQLGHPTLVLDLDPQGNASSWLGGRDDSTALLDALMAEGDISLAGLVRSRTTANNVELIPSSPQLARAERYLGDAIGGARVLANLLEALDRRWDFLLMDCPPALGQLTINALAAADELLVPVEASPMAVAGLADLVKTATKVQSLLNPRLSLSGVFACRVDNRTLLARDVIEALRARFPAIALTTVIRETVRLREAWGESLPITVYAPHSSAADDYRSLAREILEPKEQNVLQSA